jgi:hypothetical protein
MKQMTKISLLLILLNSTLTAEILFSFVIPVTPIGEQHPIFLNVQFVKNLGNCYFIITNARHDPTSEALKQVTRISKQQIYVGDILTDVFTIDYLSHPSVSSHYSDFLVKLEKFFNEVLNNNTSPIVIYNMYNAVVPCDQESGLYLLTGSYFELTKHLDISGQE